MTTIAFIGLGIMGSPMSVHLARAGYDVVGYNLTPDRTGPLEAAGGRAAGSVAEAVAEADVVAVMVPDSPDVQAVLTGEDGVFDTAKPGTLVIDFSSIRPDVTAQLDREATERGLRLVEVPIAWYYHASSRVDPLRDTIRMIRDILRVRLNDWRGRYA